MCEHERLDSDVGTTAGELHCAEPSVDVMVETTTEPGGRHPYMNPYVVLGTAILAEVIGTTSLKLSQGFSRPLPSLGVLVGYGAAFYFLSIALEDLPVGVVYGTWAALGIVAIAAIGVVAFDEPVDIAGIVGIGLIIAGVYCLNVVSGMSAH
jgi:small multidrug resistance pump